MEVAMAEEKSITGKLAAVIGTAAEVVKSGVHRVIDTASNAAQHAMEANAEKLSRLPPARRDPDQVAGTTNEQVYIPEASEAAAMSMPLVANVPAAKKRKSSTKPAAKPATKKAAAGKPTKSAAKSRAGSSKTSTRKSGK
jgi:hypothetical protein